jgi:hypothetical protein
MGPAGSMGPRGFAGSMGPRGFAGSMGPAGAAGAAGSTGPRGFAGPAGPSGTLDPVNASRIAQVQNEMPNKADKSALGSFAAYAQTQFALKANQADLGALAASNAAQHAQMDASINRNASAIAKANLTLQEYAVEIAKVSARVTNVEYQPLFVATISGNQTAKVVSWNSVVRSTNNSSTRISIATTNGVVGIRLAPGTYILTTAIAAQQAYTAWTQWAWRENVSNAWVVGSEIALVGNGTAAQSDTGALIIRVDDNATTFSLQLKEQATNGGTPTLLAQTDTPDPAAATQVVVIGINVPTG